MPDVNRRACFSLVASYQGGLHLIYPDDSDQEDNLFLVVSVWCDYKMNFTKQGFKLESKTCSCESTLKW